MNRLKGKDTSIPAILAAVSGSVLLGAGLFAAVHILVASGVLVLVAAICFLLFHLLKANRELATAVSDLSEKAEGLESRISDIGTELVSNRKSLEYRICAMQGIYSFLGEVEAPMSLMKGFAMAPESSFLFLTLITEKKPEHILDIGSGISTILAGYTVKKLNRGHVWSLEHHAEYYEQTSRMILQHRLEDFVTLIHSPLTNVEISGESWRWYDLSHLPGGMDFDLVLVDGPPGSLQKLARYPALPLLRSRMPEHAILMLDDAIRPDEKVILERWLGEFPEWKLQPGDRWKGAAILSD